MPIKSFHSPKNLVSLSLFEITLFARERDGIGQQETPMVCIWCKQSTVSVQSLYSLYYTSRPAYN